MRYPMEDERFPSYDSPSPSPTATTTTFIIVLHRHHLGRSWSWVVVVVDLLGSLWMWEEVMTEAVKYLVRRTHFCILCFVNIAS